MIGECFNIRKKLDVKIFPAPVRPYRRGEQMRIDAELVAARLIGGYSDPAGAAICNF